MTVMTVPPILQHETAILPKILIFPFVSWPHLCWNRQPSWPGELPLGLHSHCASLESASVIPIETQENERKKGRRKKEKKKGKGKNKPVFDL